MKDYNTSSDLNNVIDTTMEKIKTLMKTNTIVGDPLYIGNVSIIPISKVSVGFVVGGGEYSDKSDRRVANHYPMTGGTGGGMSISPVGFLINSDGDIKYVDVEDKTAYQATLNIINKLSELVPSILKKVGMSDKGDKNGNQK